MEFQPLHKFLALRLFSFQEEVVFGIDFMRQEILIVKQFKDQVVA